VLGIRRQAGSLSYIRSLASSGACQKSCRATDQALVGRKEVGGRKVALCIRRQAGSLSYIRFLVSSGAIKSHSVRATIPGWTKEVDGRKVALGIRRQAGSRSYIRFWFEQRLSKAIPFDASSDVAQFMPTFQMPDSKNRFWSRAQRQRQSGSQGETLCPANPNRISPIS
jgi:hypothetical protein